jgi:type IV secretion system protein VirB10
MVGVAGGIVAIIVLTGNQEPSAPRAATAAPAAAALAPNPEQLRDYQRRLEAADRRPQAPPPPPALLRSVADDGALSEPAPPRPQDTLAEERQRRDYESLFASNVVQSPTLPTTDSTRSVATRRPMTGTSAEPTVPSLDDVANAVLRASEGRTAAAAAPASAPAPVAPATRSPAPPETTPADGPLHRMLEGTIIDTTLMNRLDGGAASLVNCLVSNPIYSTSTQDVLIPAGARVIGTTKPVQSFGETRLAVSFSRIVMPNGRTYSLEQFTGANAIGDSGLRDHVNRHYASTFGAAAAVGFISGFAQYVGGGLWNRNNSPVVVVGNVGDATAQAASQTMSHFLNRLPTITIREGHRVKIYLTSDLQLPAYTASQPDRGLRLAGKVQP